jgi:hypothetical protein
VAYQTLHRADQKRGQRNFPEGLFVLLEIKRSAGMMTGFAICHFYFLILTSYFLRVFVILEIKRSAGMTIGACRTARSSFFLLPSSFLSLLGELKLSK